MVTANEAAIKLAGDLIDTDVMSVGVGHDDLGHKLIVYVAKKSLMRDIPTEFEGYRVEVIRAGSPRPAAH